MAINLETTYGAGRVNTSDPVGYPVGAIKNETSPGADDGTQIDEAWGNDNAGSIQAVLYQAGLVPDNVPEKVSASQMLQGIARHVSGSTFYTDTGAVNAYVLEATSVASTAFETPSALFDGMLARFIPPANNTGACTVDVEYQGVSIDGAKDLTLEDGTALAGDELVASTGVSIRFNFGNDRWELLGVSVAAASVPVGAITHVAANAIPDGWLKTNGAAVSRTT